MYKVCPLVHRHEDVRCYVKDGWKLLHNQEGEISHYGPFYKIDLGEIRASPNDMVVLLELQGKPQSEKISETLRKLKLEGAILCSIHITDKDTNVSPSEVKKSTKVFNVYVVIRNPSACSVIPSKSIRRTNICRFSIKVDIECNYNG